MALIEQFFLTVVAAALIIGVLMLPVFRRLNQGFVLILGACLIGLAALYFFFGWTAVGTGLICVSAVLALGGILYGVLSLLERWAKAGE